MNPTPRTLAEPIESASVTEATRLRLATGPTQLVTVDDPRGAVDGDNLELTALRASARRFQLASVVLAFGALALSALAGALYTEGPQDAASATLFAVTGLLVAFTALPLVMRYEALNTRADRWEKSPQVEVPANVRDAWRRIHAVIDARTDVPEAMLTSALHADDVLVEIAEHHRAGTGGSSACAELADALFTVAARTDTWDLLTTMSIGDGGALTLPASASLMLEASAGFNDSDNGRGKGVSA